jgi:nucleoside-diphosphate-sugar epimerase
VVGGLHGLAVDDERKALHRSAASGRDIEFLSVDLQDKEAARAAFEQLTDITHIASTALHEKPELVAGWSSKERIETNNAMLHNVVEPIVRTASNFQHIGILQGTKIYGVHLHPIPIPARERDARKDHENFFFDQEAYVRETGAKHGFNYTALRPQLVTGAIMGRHPKTFTEAAIRAPEQFVLVDGWSLVAGSLVQSCGG